jgi:hypothetical protein
MRTKYKEVTLHKERFLVEMVVDLCGYHNVFLLGFTVSN